MKLPIHIIADIITVLVLLIFIFRGRQRGLVKTLAGIISLVLAFSLAGTLATSTTPYISENYVSPYIDSQITEKTETTYETQNESFYDIKEIFVNMGIPENLVSDAFTDISKSLSMSFQEPLKLLTNSISYKLTFAVLFIIYFILLRLLLSLLFKLLNLASKLPVINFINKSLGLISGAILGYLIVVFLSFILVKFGLFLTESVVSETIILKHLIAFSPISLF
ncbi:MAG: CvpA family protein [Oscillospiraceae bacterium]|nr:CvpA family protein [Oscillospiraceae bacterium]